MITGLNKPDEELRKRLGRKTKQGKTKVHIPPASRIRMFGTMFTVAAVTKAAIILEVVQCPAEIKPELNITIFGGEFRVSKITLPQTHNAPTRVAMVPKNSRTVIDPKRLPRK